ncbi:MAG: ABC transporter substrate-binding protein [Candidatus Cloacimonetes bacterium]|nr:ABC transporter substrate-binding protein [Candidatus Cloacimonadota bacterium]
MLKINSIFLCSLVCCLFLITCGTRHSTEIVFWHALGGPPGDTLNRMVEDFNHEHPDIRVKAISMGNYQALSQKIMASIQANNQPDLAQVYESWTANLINGQAIVQLDQFIDDDPAFKADLADIFPVFIKSNTFDGKIYSFPFNKSVRVMYYNKDIFYRNGLDHEAPPVTWQEFIELCKLFTTDRKGTGKIDQCGTSFNTDMWRFENLLLQAGGDILNPDQTTPAFNTEAGIEALEFFLKLLHEDKSAYLSPSFEAQNHFLAENIAFVEGSSTSYIWMQTAEVNFNMGIAPVPIYKTDRNIISGTNIAIFDKKDTARSKAAWEFVKWFSLPEQTAKFSANTYYMPIRRSAIELPILQEKLQEQPGLLGIYKQLENADIEPQIPKWFEFRRYMEENVLEKVFLQNLSPSEALLQAETRWNAE